MNVNPKISLIVVFTALYIQAVAQQEKDTLSFAQIEFDVSSHNFGDLIQGEKAEFEFKFKNAGSTPLILQNVLTTCGCTVPDWPKDPILPSAEGVIRVVFDSKARIGRQNKLITIRSNSRDGDFRLSVTAMVLPRKK